MKNFLFYGNFLLLHLVNFIEPITVDTKPHLRLTRQVDFTIERVVFSNKTPQAIIDFQNFTVKKFNRTHKAASGSLTILKDIDNEYEVSEKLKLTLELSHL
jgi:hypothetical protein